MAQVYKAYQPMIERFVAIKVMHSHLAESADFAARFKREARGLGQLRHPHIVSIIDFDAEAEYYYYDGDGNRLLMSVAGVVTTYTLDYGNGRQILLEEGGAFATTKHYLYGLECIGE